MQLYVEEHEEEPSFAQNGGSSDAGTRDIKIRRSASCTMAWELDCVACDVVPLDSDHIVVLGLVSLEEEGEEGEWDEEDEEYEEGEEDDDDDDGEEAEDEDPSVFRRHSFRRANFDDDDEPAVQGGGPERHGEA